jgi:rubrerythrin
MRRRATAQPFSGGNAMTTGSPMDVIRMALDREKVAYRNYREFARLATEPEIRQLFEYLAEEENKHVKLLSDEIEKETHQEM